MAEVRLHAAKRSPARASNLKLHIARYEQSRSLSLGLVTQAQYVDTILRDIGRYAQYMGLPHEQLEELATSRHKFYGPDHPWAWIRPYLDPTKLRIYLDCYPGLSEM